MKLSKKPRIVYIVDSSYGAPYPYAFAGLVNTMEKMGLEISCLNPATATLESFRQEIEEFKPELIFGFIQHPLQIKKIAGFLDEYHPVDAINWYDEDPNGVVGNHSEIDIIELTSSFDMWFGIDAKMVPFWKTKAAFMPPAFDEHLFRNEGLERIYDVSYIGQLGPERITKMYWPYMKEMSSFGKKAMLSIDRPMGVPLLPKPLEKFLRSKKRRKVFQKMPFWKCHWYNPEDEKAKAMVINQSKIHVGINRVLGDWEEGLKKRLPEYHIDHHGLFYQMKMRPFQAVGCGALALNEYCPELENLFEIGKEIVTFEYGDVSGFRDKLSWYISHDAEREKIAKAGYERGRKEHTFTARIKQIFNCIRKTL